LGCERARAPNYRGHYGHNCVAYSLARRRNVNVYKSYTIDDFFKRKKVFTFYSLNESTVLTALGQSRRASKKNRYMADIFLLEPKCFVRERGNYYDYSRALARSTNNVHHHLNNYVIYWSATTLIKHLSLPSPAITSSGWYRFLYIRHLRARMVFLFAIVRFHYTTLTVPRWPFNSL